MMVDTHALVPLAIMALTLIAFVSNSHLNILNIDYNNLLLF